MYWFLNFNYNDGYNMELTMINMHKNCYNKLNLVDFDNFEEFENRVIDMMNFSISLRDSVYLVCDIRNNMDRVFYTNFRLLSNRINKDVIDSTSFNILNTIKCV